MITNTIAKLVRASGRSPLVVTRHDGLVQLMLAEGLIGPDAEVLDHIEDASVLEGRVVFGILPLDLAARCAAVVHIPLRLPPSLRGAELPVEVVRELAGAPRVFKIHEIVPEDLVSSPVSDEQDEQPKSWLAQPYIQL